ncbi:MAG: type I-U CRISPR-associated helicase/endonuclease Cas3 [Xanthobacteraceae bacterium]|nr:type I-U CRISPR-associated helicase/endonuclease Cas3 [Xanthobacteraceae bacterium]
MARFRAEFESIQGKSPLLWQRRLFRRFCGGELPRLLDIPTGLGKTSVILVWLLALAAQARDGTSSLPRRLVYVVNRRTVVDQATDTALAIRKALRDAEPGSPAAGLREALRNLCLDPDDDASPVAVSTLRGELADNREWQVDPARPAIVVGTVDMIGSRLLFSGYGAGRSYGRALSAGILGHDALLVHDEAHLSPAFGVLVRFVARTQVDAQERRPLRIMELSATPPAPDESRVDEPPFTLTDEEKQEGIVRKRVEAAKALRLVEVTDQGDLPAKLIEAALAHRDARARILIYVRSPELADKVRDGLGKALGRLGRQRVGMLTGTMRGSERDELAAGEFFRSFRAATDREPVEESRYLVATSAGEVGVDLDADHLVCDLTTLDSLIQRFGRVNRLGRDDANFVSNIALHYAMDDKDTDDAERCRATETALRNLAPRGDDFDASPAALRALVEGLGTGGIARAFAVPPQIVPCTDILLDTWALTSLRSLPGQPPVERWLHGIERDLPETTVVWRAEADRLCALAAEDERRAEARGDDSPAEASSLWAEMVEQWLDSHPIFARERLRDRADRVARQVAEIVRRHPEARGLLTVPPGPARCLRLVEADKDALAGAWLVLPTQVGGFDSEGGVMNGRFEGQADDVADLGGDLEPTRLRVLLERDEEGTWRVTLLGRRRDGLAERIREAVSGVADSWPLDRLVEHLLTSLNDGRTAGRLIEKEPRIAAPERETGATWALVSFGQARAADTLFAASATASERQMLVDHSRWTEIAATRVGRKVALGESLASALSTAGRWHDRGKARNPWQRAIGNPRPDQPWAKSGGRGFKLDLCPGYRHEFGSLREAADDPAIATHPESDLILHLIASHHGWARPHFEPDHWDIALDAGDDENAALAAETLRRYARLQRRFGRWGLAWLEALMKAADALASSRGRGVEELAP